jgi:hypothetical protein
VSTGIIRRELNGDARRVFSYIGTGSGQLSHRGRPR